jgi:cytochrome c peroxidase
VEHEQDFDEVERWLKDEPATAGSEFDRFLAQRATAIEKQPERGADGQQKDKQNNSLL